MLTNIVTGAHTDSGIRHVVVEMMAGGELGERLRRHGNPVHSLGMARGRPNAAATFRFARLLLRERPSIIQTWLYHADLLGLIGSTLSGSLVVWNIRSAWHQGVNGFAPRMCARLSGFPAAVVVNSQAGQLVHRDIGYHPRRWCLIPNGFDLEIFRPDEGARAGLRAEIGVGADTPLVGIVGRWDPHKDHDTFFAAAARLRQRRGDVHYVLVGDGLTLENRAVSSRIAEFNLSKCVHLLGRRSDIPRITAALDVASCTSIAEAFPNVVGEAMASGVPCVATNVGDAAILVGDPELVVPPRDVAALVSAWARLLEMDSSSRRGKGLRGRARIAEHYSLDGVVWQYERLYEELMSEGKPQ